MGYLFPSILKEISTSVKREISITLIAMNAQPAQQQGEIKFHNYLVDFISFDTMNEKQSQITTK